MTSQPAILYLRVSTQEQASEGVSLAAQEARLRAYATLRGLSVVQVVTDAGVSGSVPLGEREGGRELLAAIDSAQRVGRKQREPVHILAVKLDRLFRNTVDALEVSAEWDRRGVSMHLVDMGGQSVDTSSAIGRFFLTMLAGVAEMERQMIGERTSAALRHKVATGQKAGGTAPFGFRHDGQNTVPDAGEQKTLEKIRELRGASLSIRKICATLNADLASYPARGCGHRLGTVAAIIRKMEAA
jgi:DNA invertase Pin-like site-specific DNA recombinase